MQPACFLYLSQCLDLTGSSCTDIMNDLSVSLGNIQFLELRIQKIQQIHKYVQQQIQTQQKKYMFLDSFIDQQTRGKIPSLSQPFNEVCEPLISGVRECLSYQPIWPLMPSWSAHDHCSHLVHLLTAPPTPITSTTTTSTTSTSTFPMTTTTHSTTAFSTSSSINTDKMVTHNNNNANRVSVWGWTYVHTLCLLVGLCLGLMGYSIFWKSVRVTREFFTQWTPSYSISGENTRPSHAFTYVATKPADTFEVTNTVLFTSTLLHPVTTEV